MGAFSARGDAIDTLAAQLAYRGYHCKREYAFAPHVDGKPVRRWRTDLALPDLRVGFEVDGSMFSGGRHGGTRSVVRDLEKRNAQACLGWKMIHVTPAMVNSGEALLWALAALEPENSPIPL